MYLDSQEDGASTSSHPIRRQRIPTQDRYACSWKGLMWIECSRRARFGL